MCSKVRRHIKSHINVILRHMYDIYKPLNKYGMKKLIVVALMLVGSLTYAHPRTHEENRKVYEHIQQLLEDDLIDVKTAQTMWKSYIECCEE